MRFVSLAFLRPKAKFNSPLYRAESETYINNVMLENRAHKRKKRREREKQFHLCEIVLILAYEDDFVDAPTIWKSFHLRSVASVRMRRSEMKIIKQIIK